MRTLFRRDNRLFTLTCVGLLLVAGAHTWAIFTELPEDFDAVLDELHLAVLDTGTPWSPSLFEVVAGVWVLVGALLAGMAVLNLVALAASGGDARVKRALAIANLVVFVPVTVLFVVVPIPQALLAFAVASVLFFLDLRYSRGDAE